MRNELICMRFKGVHSGIICVVWEVFGISCGECRKDWGGYQAAVR